MTATTPANSSPLAAAGAVCAAIAVALGAYATHAATGAAQGPLQTAAAVAFGHGIALAALGRGLRTRLCRLALGALLLGTVLFAGSIALHALAGVAPVLAPFGGMLLIAGWLLLAFDLLRS